MRRFFGILIRTTMINTLFGVPLGKLAMQLTNILVLAVFTGCVISALLLETALFRFNPSDTAVANKPAPQS